MEIEYDGKKIWGGEGLQTSINIAYDLNNENK